MAKETQIALFQLTTPEIGNVVGLQQKPKLNDKGEAVSMTLCLEKRKDLGKKLGLVGKDNSAALDKVLLGLSDKIKAASIGEMAKLATSEDWTGGQFKMSVNKSGVRRATMSLVSVNRQSHKISPDALAEALASMTDEQRTAILGQAEAKAKELAPATELEQLKA